MVKKFYKVRFWVHYKEFTHVFEVDEFMFDVFGECFPCYFFECDIYGRTHECVINLKEMTLSITPLEDDGETLMTACREEFDDRFWIIEKVEDDGEQNLEKDTIS